MAPIIGITTYGRHERQIESIHYDGYYTLPADYVDAVRRAGGVPILLPPGENNWEAWLEIIDGLIISGGSDIEPGQYNGNSNHPNLTKHAPTRDESELALAKSVLQKIDTPSLFICRGMQVVNVAAGGSLHEHIPDIQPEDIHRGEDGGWAMQAVNVESGSALEKVMQVETAVPYSGHHQAIKEVGEGLKVSSKAADGIIEALEKTDHPYFIAVQWHPEKSAADDESQQRLFDKLVQAAKKKKRGN